jgi:malate dehydrogenase (oxaloacetate-decarboxylating)
VTLAGLINALRLAHKQPKDCRVVINGAGAAGLTITNLLQFHGFVQIVVCDTKGILNRGRDYSDNKYKKRIAEVTNPADLRGNLEEALVKADIFIGVSGPGALKH